MKKIMLMFAAAATFCACSNQKAEAPATDAAAEAQEVVNAAAEECGKCCEKECAEAPCCAMKAAQAELDSLKALGDKLDEAGKAKLAELEQKVAELKEAAEAKVEEGKEAVEGAVEAAKDAANNVADAAKDAVDAAKNALKK